MSTGELAIRDLLGVERGSIVTLSMVLDALLESEADSVVFLHVREKFISLLTSGDTLNILYNALIGVCDLAISYDGVRADEIGSAILDLATPVSYLN